MLFNSFSFAVFFPVVTVLYFALPYRWRNALLLVASCIFYCAAIPAYLLILWFTIVVDYFAGLLIESATGPQRKRFLLLSICANVGVLVVFKYGNFIWGNVAWLGSFVHWQPPFHVAIMMPIGLSFHTFQAMSYTIEVYRGRQAAERHFWTYALYVMFYPQLVAGPIERPQHLLHQFRERHAFNPDRATKGLRRMLAGFFKKIVVADRLAMVVDPIYASPAQQSAPALLLAMLCFAVEIYCDFSGYCDIAIGAAQVMGFRLVENFKFPLWSRSLGEYWQRWHISLTSWFRDYVFAPMGRRASWTRRYISLLVTFFLAGLWHGPNWTYVAWAMYHGLWFATAHAVRKLRKRIVGPIPRHLQGIVSVIKFTGTLTGICIGGVFFRSRTVTEAIDIIGRLFNPFFWQRTMSQWPPGNLDRRSLWISVGAIALATPVEYLLAHKQLDKRVDAGPLWVRWMIYYTVVFAILVFGEFEARPFFYFQF